jgi:hypothetical protein
VTVSLDSALLGYYNAKAGVASTTTSSTSKAAAPTPPWKSASSSSSTATAAATSAATGVAQQLLDGEKLINPSSAQLTTTTNDAAENTDYQNLFALYKGLTSLQSIATAASSKSISSSQLATLQKAFTNGLSQVQTYIASQPFSQFQVGDGVVSASDETTSGVAKTSTTYTTGLTAATSNTVLSQLTGNEQFSLTVSLPNHSTPTTVNFNLADLGDTPLTLSNIVSYLNTQLAAAGVNTRFGDKVVTIPGTPIVSPTATTASTSKSSTSSSTTTTSAPTSEVELQVLGNSLETVSFSAPTSSDAVYIAQTSTKPTLGTTSTTSATSTTTSSTSTSSSTVSQLLAFDPSGENTTNTIGELWSNTLPSTATIQATTTGPDGSVYVLANLDGTTNGETITGSQDEALLKYDSAGNLVYQRAVGDLNSATGYALAVSPDGSQVAIAGSTTAATSTGGATNLTAPAATQSTVTVFDASSGNQLWTKSQDATSNNQVNGVAFGSDNAVYVVGQAAGALPNQTATGAQGAYVQAFTATSSTTTTVNATTGATTTSTLWNAASASTTEFGTSGVNRATSVAVNGSNVYVASVQNGDAVVNEYTAGSTGALSLTATQDLGALDGGNLSGIALNPDGSLTVAGTTGNGALNAGAITNAYTSGQSAFVAQLSANLDPTNGESLAYVNEGGDTTATSVTVDSSGQVYITGQVATGGSTANGQVSEHGYAAQVDPTTGAVNWSQTFQGLNGNAAPTSIAVSSNGSSALSALGLPNGPINQPSSTTLTANTSVTAGDKFYIQVGEETPVAVTISATDTYATLAAKIEKASGEKVTAKTTTGAGGKTQLVITPTSKNSPAKVSIEAGPTDGDALGPLGLKAGLITNASTITNQATPDSNNTPSKTNTLKAAYNIDVPTTLNLSSTTNIAAAQSQINTALAQIKDIYYNLTTPPSTSTSASTNSTSDAAKIALSNSQNAAYTSALKRLTASSSSSSTGSTLGDLIAASL